jgi:hypothetical protein
MQTMRFSTIPASRHAAMVATGKATKPRAAVARVVSASAAIKPTTTADDDAQIDRSRRDFLATGAFSIIVAIDREARDLSKGDAADRSSEEAKKYERRSGN